MNILIVEDEYITRTFLTSIINWKENNMNLIGTAKDGFEAMSIVKQEIIDIIITDLKMPKMNGNDLIKELRDINFDGKIIVLSNYDDFNMVKDAMKNGAFEYLLKATINKDELLKTINNAKKELENTKKNMKRCNLIDISNEKLKVQEFLEEYLKNKDTIELEENLKVKYLTNLNLIHVIAEDKDIDDVKKEKKLGEFISNIVNTHALYTNLDFTSIINIRRNEYVIIIKINKIIDLELLLSNIKRNVHYYLGINFKEVFLQKFNDINSVLNYINKKYEEDKYKFNDKVYNCRVEVKKVIVYIENNINKKISLEKLASVVNMNESYLSRIFKEELNITISDYIKLKRLEYAKELLKQKNMRIKDVAINVGISDQLYFSRMFTKQFGITPSDYRDKYNRM